MRDTHNDLSQPLKITQEANLFVFFNMLLQKQENMYSTLHIAL